MRIIPKEVSKGETPDLTVPPIKIPPIKIPWDPWEGLGVKIPEKILADVLPGPDVRIPHIPNLVIDGGVEFIWNHGGGSLSAGKPAQQPVDLQSIIEDLRTQILGLQSRVEALGG